MSYVWFPVQSPPPLGADAIALRNAGKEGGEALLFVLRMKKGGVSAAAHKVVVYLRVLSVVPDSY